MRVTADDLIEALKDTLEAEPVPTIRGWAQQCVCGHGRSIIEILDEAERLPQSGDAIVLDPGPAADARPRIANNLDRKAKA